MVDWLAEKQAEDIVLLDVRKVSLFADFLVLGNGTTERQLDALSTEVREQAKKAGIAIFHAEGQADSGWVLLDYGSVVVHLLSPRLRAYYRLEEVWRDSSVVVRMP
jgi:ribosome-associated protein